MLLTNYLFRENWTSRGVYHKAGVNKAKCPDLESISCSELGLLYFFLWSTAVQARKPYANQVFRLSCLMRLPLV